MTVLVTGATGFVGSHLVRDLRERDEAVRALVRPSSNTAALKKLGIELFEGDLTDPDSLDGVCDGVEAVYHCACAVAGTFDADRDAVQRFLAVNRDGSVNLARRALEQGVRLVHLSSTAAMGTPRTQTVDETSECAPRTPYQISKREAELALLDLHRREGLDVVILRPCVIAGEGKEGGELLKLFKLVKRGLFPFIGSRTDAEKPMVMVDDVVSAMTLALERGRAGEIYLIHSDGHHTMGDIVATAGRLTGAKRTHLPVPLPLARAMAKGFALVNRALPRFNPPLTPERVELFVKDRHIDIGKARRELGFDPQVTDLETMLGRTFRYYQAQGLI